MQEPRKMSASQVNVVKMTRIQEVVSWPFLTLIKVYRYTISPLLGQNCRFHPTCSCYAHQAIEHHGLAKGLVLSIKRIVKCHPLHPGGIDPVPGHTEDSSKK